MLCVSVLVTQSHVDANDASLFFHLKNINQSNNFHIITAEVLLRGNVVCISISFFTVPKSLFGNADT